MNLSEDFVRLLSASQKRLHVFICTLVVDKADADDVLQETNVALCQLADRYQPGTNFLAWACRIAHYRVLKHRTAAKQLRIRFSDELGDALTADALADMTNDATPSDDLFERRRAALNRCLRKVPIKQRRVLRAYYDGSRSLRDVGLTCGMNANAVAQLLFRIRAGLRTCILERLAADA
jgi:RNA polymerase sigma-70 factor, ECF subfamily